MRATHGAVWHGERRVGALREDSRGTLRFAYDADWLSAGGFPVSIRIPLSNGDAEVDAHAYFAGLLPEGWARQRICASLGVADDDDAALLFALGEDCAGALSVLPAGPAPMSAESAAPRGPERLAAEQLERLVRTRGREPAAGWERAALAGAQEKRAVIVDAGAYALPDRAHPSSHILKFETVPQVCFAESMGNEIARRAGLPVAATEFLAGSAEATPYLRVERYDRHRGSDGTLRRVHQEDLMQALGLPGRLKYQRRGGPSLADAAELLRAHAAHAEEALRRLRDWQIFNCLAGNWDGHGKNFSLLWPIGAQAPMPAPFYDLIPFAFLNLSRDSSVHDLAFAVGRHVSPERIERDDWLRFARELGLPPKPVLERLEELAGLLPSAAAEARRDFAARHGDARAYDGLAESVRRRCVATLDSL